MHVYLIFEKENSFPDWRGRGGGGKGWRWREYLNLFDKKWKLENLSFFYKSFFPFLSNFYFPVKKE